MVFQNYALYPHMTVYDNMAFGLKIRKFPKTKSTRGYAKLLKFLKSKSCSIENRKHSPVDSASALR